MKSVEYRHSWSGVNRDDAMREKFGTLLVDHDTSEAYETEESLLFKKGTKYYWLSANGCSCWDGDYDGWELSKPELRKLAEKTLENPYRESADILVARWVKDNI